MYILHTLEQVLKRIEVCTIETNVIVILAGAFVRGPPLDDIWIAFRVDKDLRFYSINAICTALGDSNFKFSIN